MPRKRPRYDEDGNKRFDPTTAQGRENVRDAERVKRIRESGLMYEGCVGMRRMISHHGILREISPARYKED